MLLFTLDSNILFYAADPSDSARHMSALEILRLASARNCMLIPQALAEFFSATTRKNVMPRAQALAQVRDLMQIFPVSAGPTADAILDAASASAAGQFQF